MRCNTLENNQKYQSIIVQNKMTKNSSNLLKKPFLQGCPFEFTFDLRYEHRIIHGRRTIFRFFKIHHSVFLIFVNWLQIFRRCGVRIGHLSCVGPRRLTAFFGRGFDIIPWNFGRIWSLVGIFFRFDGFLLGYEQPRWSSNTSTIIVGIRSILVYLMTRLSK